MKTFIIIHSNRLYCLQIYYFEIYVELVVNLCMLTIMNIVSGEKLQNLCDYYLGTQDHFDYNPFIKSQSHKHLCIDSLDIENQIANMTINNLFCYLPLLETHLHVLVKVLSYIKTPVKLFPKILPKKSVNCSFNKLVSTKKFISETSL